MPEYSDDVLVEELVVLYGNNVQYFLSVIVPAGFPDDIISQTTQPRPAYTLFWKHLWGLSEDRQKNILDALSKNKLGSEILKNLLSSSGRRKCSGGAGHGSGAGENLTGKIDKVKQNIRIVNTLPKVDVKALDTCHMHDETCDFQRPSLALVAELARFDETTHETLVLVTELKRIKSLASRINKLKPGEYNDIAKEEMLELKDAIDQFFKQISLFRRKRSPYKGKCQRSKYNQAKNILTHRAKSIYGTSAASTFIKATKSFLEDYKRSHWYLTGYRDEHEALSHHLSEISHYAGSLINYTIATVKKSMKESYMAIPEAFKPFSLSKISECMGEVLNNLAHNCGKSPTIWGDTGGQQGCR